MEFECKGFTYRIKKMNMIELMALRSVIRLDNVDKALACYNAMLERIEVKVKDAWLQVKQDNAYFPADVENDAETIEVCLAKMLAYIQSVFQKSDASNA